MKKMFIVGCVRSGTTLLQQILNRHSEVIIPPETGFFNRFLGHTMKGQFNQLRRINADLRIDLPFPRRCIREGREAVHLYERIELLYTQRLRASGATYFGEKTPQHLFCLRRIARLFPDAKVLLIYRDGRDVALSMTKVPWCPPNLYINFAFWLRCCNHQKRAIEQSDLDLLLVKYENLVCRPEYELKRITDFLGIAYHSHIIEGHGNREGIAEWEYGWKARSMEKITTSRVGNWRRELTMEHINLLERWGGRVLQSLGYPLVTDPLDRLPWSFFLMLYFKQSKWWLRVVWEMATKEFLSHQIMLV